MFFPLSASTIATAFENFFCFETFISHDIRLQGWKINDSFDRQYIQYNSVFEVIPLTNVALLIILFNII